MKIEVLKTLKGARLVRRGTVFDDAVAPIPSNILKELSSGADTVRMIGAQIATEKPIVAVEPEIEIKQPVPENDFKDLPVSKDDAERIIKVFETVEKAQERLTTLDELERLINHYPSIGKVAKTLGASVQSISRWRKGQNKPSDEFAAKIHKAFKGLS